VPNGCRGSSSPATYGVNGPTAPRAIATRDITLQVSVPILDGFRREARLDEQDAVVRESQVREADLRRRSPPRWMPRARSGLAPRRNRRWPGSSCGSPRASSARRGALQAGVAGNIDVITAQAGLIRARDTEIDARFAAASARISLRAAAGVARTLH